MNTVSLLFILQALAIDPANTKALYRRAQGWQGIRDFDQALVITIIFLLFKGSINHLLTYFLFFVEGGS